MGTGVWKNHKEIPHRDLLYGRSYTKMGEAY